MCMFRFRSVLLALAVLSFLLLLDAMEDLLELRFLPLLPTLDRELVLELRLRGQKLFPLPGLEWSMVG
ncbi:hypothetical protein P280DRAFT_473129 [Massarina eburnea CBS 473.64]|uniref:Uncharacterized protein n=1 Tax=Massarina eburnea CBS 473.64 TaxID=1395130 RepID=A0A6A6RL17_9PLEO|nr:hypothetical protein P280DRAFT_473129 [Massarina eburnea CBS 473.64]